MSITPNSPNRPWVVQYGHTLSFTFFIPPGTVATAAVIERFGVITATSMGGPTSNYEEKLTIGGNSQVLGAITAAGQVDDVMTLNSTQLAALNTVGFLGGNLTVVLDATTATGGSPGGQDTVANLYLTFAATVAAVPTLSPTPNYNGGAPGGDAASGLTTNLYTLTGTAITEISTDALALSARVHRQAKGQYNQVELWYQDRSNLTWYLSPVQPVTNDAMAPRLTRRYQAPYTLDFYLPDNSGALTPENLNSATNYNQAGDYDPLLDEARPVLLRVGCSCFGDLAAGLTPTFATDGTATESGALSLLTDGALNNYAVGVSDCCVVAPGTSTYAAFTLDLGSVQPVRHVVARTGSREGSGTTYVVVSSPTSFTSGAITPATGVGTGVTMAIPSGSWTAATWTVTGTATGTPSSSPIACYTSAGALVYHATGGFGSGSGGSFSGTSAATAQQIADINAAAGSSMDVWANVSGSILSATITSLTLTLTDATGVALPLSLTVSLSSDNITYHDLTARPIGGAGDSGHAPGDWDDNPSGIAVEVAVTDIDSQARYVRFRLDLPPRGSIAVDELAVYGGTTYGVLGRNYFVGYLGDATDIDSQGLIYCTATDVKKRLADNTSVTLTAAYEQTNTTPKELADIAYSLLTSTSYWTGAAGTYNAPFGSMFIGWPNGVNYTGFQFPLWQGQTNSMLGYTEELWHDIGWSFYADGNGVLQAKEPAYSQVSPDRVLIAASLTGNGDLREVKRQRTGKNIRNKIRVTSGKATDTGAGLTQEFDPNSVARYGERMMVIADPVLVTQQLRDKVAQSVLRDYGTRSQEVMGKIQPDFDTALRQVHGLRAQGRTSLYAKASAFTGAKRLRELWQVQELTETIALGDWTGQVRYIPYLPQTVQAPYFTSIDPGTSSGLTATIRLHFDPILDPKVQYVQVYFSTVGEAGPYTLETTMGPAPNSIALTVSTASTIWVYLTAVDAYGVASLPSQVLSVLPGSAGDSSSDFYVGDLAVGYVAQSGPDANLAYTYQFYGTWTSPNTADGLGGFCQSYTKADTRDPRSAFDGLNPYLYQINVAHWWASQRIPVGKTWDRVTAGILDANWTFRTTSNLSGTTLYFRMFTSTQTSGFYPHHPPCLGSNVVAVTIP